MLPRNSGEPTILIGGPGEQKTAFFLDGERRFYGFNCQGNTAYDGLIVVGVTIGLDETRAFDRKRDDPQLGSLIRQGDMLGMFMRLPDVGTRVIPIIGGLSKAPDGYATGFNHWTVGLGHGLERRTFVDVDIRNRP